MAGQPSACRSATLGIAGGGVERSAGVVAGVGWTMAERREMGLSGAYIGHDQLFKQLLQALFADFLRQFDPETAGALDLRSITFRDTEAFTDVPQGERRLLDLVAEIPAKVGTSRLVLVHVEVQRAQEPDFPKRMWVYYHVLRLRYDLPVVPIALVFYPVGAGIALAGYEDAALERTVETFRFLQICLPRLEATAYLQAETVLGAALACTMHLPPDRPSQIGVHLAVLRRVHQALLAGAIDEARASLLVNLVSTYLPLSHGEEESLRVSLMQEGDPTMEVMELTKFDQIYLQGLEKGREEGREEGLEKGREAGREEGQRGMLRQVLRRRFGAVPEALERRIAVAGQHDLTALLDQAIAATALDDLLPK